MPASQAQVELDRFIDKFSPEVATRTRLELGRMRALLPCAIEMVYDNYNALAIGYSPSERASEAIFSLAVFPRWVTLCFLQGAGLPDPYGMLKGAGNQVRHIRLIDDSLLLSAPVRALMASALKHAKVPLSPHTKYRLVIKSVSARQRPRR